MVKSSFFLIQPWMLQSSPTSARDSKILEKPQQLAPLTNHIASYLLKQHRQCIDEEMRGRRNLLTTDNAQIARHSNILFLLSEVIL